MKVKPHALLMAFAMTILIAESCRKEEFSDAPMEETIASEDEPLQNVAKASRDTMLADAVKTTAARQRMQRFGCGPDTLTLFIQFGGGRNISGAAWQIPGTFNCPGSGLSGAQKNAIFAMVKEDYSPFVIKVVKNAAQYNAAGGLKMICYVTRKNRKIMQSPVLGPVSGAAYQSSILWNDGTPAFVFADAMEMNEKNIAEAVSHELGHTFGLGHQEYYSSSCQYLGGYLPSNGSGELSRGAIMGNPYAAALSNWMINPCTGVDDAGTIAEIAGWKAEQYGNVLGSSTAAQPGNVNATLVYAHSAHAFYKKTNGTKRIILTSKGNVDLALEVFDTPNGTPTVYDDPNSTGVEVLITGKKYLRVRLSSNMPFPMYSGLPWIYSGGGSYQLKSVRP